LRIATESPSATTGRIPSENSVIRSTTSFLGPRTSTMSAQAISAATSRPTTAIDPGERTKRDTNDWWYAATRDGVGAT
jgi:hypothetical protein